MLKSLLEFCLSRRAVVLAILAIFLGAGGVAFQRLNIEAYPDPAPPIIEIITQNPGQSAEEVERFMTIPIEVSIASTPGLRYVRSISLYGLSFVRLQFSYETEYYFALQQTLNRLSNATLPTGIQPQISPAGPISEVYRYQLVGPPGMSPVELKTIQDWVLERRFKTIQGIKDVVSWGGPTKEYQVEVDLNKLVAYGITMPQLITAIGNSNINVGGRTIDIGQQSANIRGIGLIEKIEDVNNIVLSQTGGTPVLLSDVAKASIGQAPRLGVAGRDDQPDVVTGIVLMQRNEKTLDVIKRVEAEVQKINAGGILPAGVKIDPIYDRGQLVDVTVHTVMHSLVFGVVLIFVIQWLFLGDLRCAIIVAATIPFALLFATILILWRGESANLLSVGAIDLGIIVDSTVIMVENIFRNLAHGHAEDEAPVDATLKGKLYKIFASAVEVDKAIFFSVAITIAAFIPLFTMQGVEGQIFGPMAKTYGFALLGALIATFTVCPVLSSVLLPAKVREKDTFLVAFLQKAYDALQVRVLAARRLVLVVAAAIVVVTGLAASQLGTEFLPKLEEGNLWIRATLPATISLEAGRPIVNRIRDVIRSYPEVQTVVSQHGRPDDGTDPTGFFNAEFFAPLKPFDQWASGMTKEELVAKMQAQLAAEFVGVEFNFSQYIQDNIQEATSGVKGENSIKLFGAELQTLTSKGAEIMGQMETVKGVEDLDILRSLGQPNLIIQVDRLAAARYGLAPGDVNAIVQAAIGGQTATTVFEGEKQFSLVVRLAPEYRQTIDQIRSIQVATAGNGMAVSGSGGGGSGGGNPAYVPLSELAKITLDSGASFIYRENHQRYLPLKFSVRDRDLGSTVSEAQDKVTKNVPLPDGYTVDWSGEFGALQEAQKRLAIIVPLSLLLILIILYSLFNSLAYSLMAIAGIPFAICGGILALWLTGLNFSISAAVGFISLFGVSVMDGILMLTFFDQLKANGTKTNEAIALAARTRMRQMLMTGLSASIGLLPAAMSMGIGSQVQRPLATVIVGGMLVEPLMSLIMIPVFVQVFMGRDRKRKDAAPPESGETATA